MLRYKLFFGTNKPDEQNDFIYVRSAHALNVPLILINFDLHVLARTLQKH